MMHMFHFFCHVSHVVFCSTVCLMVKSNYVLGFVFDDAISRQILNPQPPPAPRLPSSYLRQSVSISLPVSDMLSIISTTQTEE